MSAASMGITDAEYMRWSKELRADYASMNRRVGRSRHSALSYGIVDSDEAATPEAVALLMREDAA